MQVLNFERIPGTTQRVHNTWLGQAISWQESVPPLIVKGMTVLPERTRVVRSETVELTRENCGLGRQAHPLAVMGVGLRAGYQACSLPLAQSIANRARLQRSRYVIVMVIGRDDPLVYFAPGNKLPLRLTTLGLSEVRYVTWSVIMARR